MSNFDVLFFLIFIFKIVRIDSYKGKILLCSIYIFLEYEREKIMNNIIVNSSTKINNDRLFLDSVEVLKDEVVHVMFRDKAFMGYIRKIVSKVLDIDEDDIDTLELAKDYLNENFDIKGSVSDVVYENKDIVLNLEFNSSKNINFELKNMKYVFHMVLNQIKAGELEKVNKLKNAIQILWEASHNICYEK